MAAIYVLGERLFAIPMSRTDVGVWAGLDPVSADSLANSDPAIGVLVNHALDQSRTGRPHPPPGQLNHLLDPLLAMAGVRRAGEFHRLAALVSVERRRNSYRVVRAVKVLEKGTARAWFGEGALSRDLLDPSDEDLGAVVRKLAISPETVRTESRAR